MNQEITTQDWYENLVSDCHAIITERVTNSKVELLTGYAEVGERIFNDENYQKSAHGNQEFVDRLFRDIGIGKSTGYKCLQFYEKFIQSYKKIEEGIAHLPEGKNISWTRIVNKYLPDNGEVKECEHEFVLMCRHCFKRKCSN